MIVFLLIFIFQSINAEKKCLNTAFRDVIDDIAQVKKDIEAAQNDINGKASQSDINGKASQSDLNDLKTKYDNLNDIVMEIQDDIDWLENTSGNGSDDGLKKAVANLADLMLNDKKPCVSNDVCRANSVSDAVCTNYKCVCGENGELKYDGGGKQWCRKVIKEGEQCKNVFITSHRRYQLEDRDGKIGLHKHHGDYQKFTLTSVGNDKWLITGINGDNLEDREDKVALHGDEGSYQQWRIEPTGIDGTYYIISHRGEYLEDREGTLGVHDGSGTYQRWVISHANACINPGVPDDECDDVSIKSHRGVYLEDRGGEIGLHKDNGAYQKWTLIRKGDEWLVVSHLGDNLEDRDDNVGLHEDEGSYQLWKIVSTTGGENKYYLISHRGEYLEDREGTLDVHESHGSYQQWTITNAETCLNF